MSRKYREYKNKLIEFYGRKGKYPPYKITLSKYKKIKRDVQWHKKNGTKVLFSPRKGVTLVYSIQYEGYKIYDAIVFGNTIWFEMLDENRRKSEEIGGNSDKN